MSSRERKKAALYEKLQLLRSVTNSSAVIPLPFLSIYSPGFLSFSSLIHFYLFNDFPSALMIIDMSLIQVSELALKGFKTRPFIQF